MDVLEVPEQTVVLDVAGRAIVVHQVVLAGAQVVLADAPDAMLYACQDVADVLEAVRVTAVDVLVVEGVLILVINHV